MPTRTVTVDEDAVAVVVEALRDAARRRQRVATTLAGELEADRAAGRDIRSGAVRVTRILVEAGQLDAAALELEGTPLDATPPPVDELGIVEEVAAAEAAGVNVIPGGAAGALERLRALTTPPPDLEPGHLLTGRPGSTDAVVRPAGDGPPTEDDVAEALAAIDGATPAEVAP